jgi:predicted dehydrogenase
MGYWHGRAARRAGADIISVIDKDARRANALARALRVSAVATEVSDLLRQQHIDAVHICTPLSTHSTLTGLVIEMGIHAFVEKPLAASAAETQKLLDLARRKAVMVCPVHQLAFQNGVVYAAQTLSRLGDLSAVEVKVCSAGGASRASSQLDAIVGEILPHPLSVLRKLLPQAPWQPERWFVVRPRQGELLVGGEHAGATFSMLVSMNARPTCFEMNILGSDGAIQLDFFHDFGLRHYGHVSRVRKIVGPFIAASKRFGTAGVNLLGRCFHGEIAYPGLRSLTRAFYDAVRHHGPSPIPPEDAIAVAIARDAILEGAPQVTSSLAGASASEGTRPQNIGGKGFP